LQLPRRFLSQNGFQIALPTWVTLDEHGWVISGERRGPEVGFGDPNPVSGEPTRHLGRGCSSALVMVSDITGNVVDGSRSQCSLEPVNQRLLRKGHGATLHEIGGEAGRSQAAASSFPVAINMSGA
jgi:hypothetical protein